MKYDELLATAKDTVTVRKVYGEPYEKDGVTIVPAAAVSGGGGGGGGQDKSGDSGEGGGFGVKGRPVGAYVIKGQDVTWRPAIDPNRLFVALAAMVIAYLLTRPRMAKIRMKKKSA
jgi:uncharacterized spore protein YtfJ